MMYLDNLDSSMGPPKKIRTTEQFLQTSLWTRFTATTKMIFCRTASTTPLMTAVPAREPESTVTTSYNSHHRQSRFEMCIITQTS